MIPFFNPQKRLTRALSGLNNAIDQLAIASADAKALKEINTHVSAEALKRKEAALKVAVKRKEDAIQAAKMAHDAALADANRKYLAKHAKAVASDTALDVVIKQADAAHSNLKALITPVD
jgi:hypothetical protein